MARKPIRVRRSNWLLPLMYALPLLVAAAVALMVWGDEIRDLIGIAVKLAVIS